MNKQTSEEEEEEEEDKTLTASKATSLLPSR